MSLKQFREIFIFTSKERNGLLILVFILFLMVCGNYFLPYMIPKKEYDTSGWEKEVTKYNHTEPVITSPKAEISAPAADSFSGKFDPNDAELKVLLQIGIPPKIAANWIKYLQKGGKFYKKEEVMKLYGMNAESYDKVRDHLIVPDKNPAEKENAGAGKWPEKSFAGYAGKDSSWRNSPREKKKIIKVDINLADSAQLEALPGIGPALASRIIKYRKLLGGYCQVTQLKEIYGMNEDWWGRIAPWVFSGTTELNKLEINYLSLTEMGRHPYIGFRTAKKIIKRRDTAGKFHATDELVSLFSSDSLQRVLPYLTVGIGEE
ncbi:MAG TPA: helix-hairpin-helix domain-containing protein [Prolixibacteraceae bacterium]